MAGSDPVLGVDEVSEIVKGQFEEALKNEIESHIDEIKASTRRRPLDASSRFMDMVVRVAKQMGLEQFLKMDRSEVLDVVAKLYDDYVAKIDLPGSFDSLLHMALKHAILLIAGAAYDRLKEKA